MSMSSQRTRFILYMHSFSSLQRELPSCACCHSFLSPLPFWHPPYKLPPPLLIVADEHWSGTVALWGLKCYQTPMLQKVTGFEVSLGYRSPDLVDKTLEYTAQIYAVAPAWLSRSIWTPLYAVLDLSSLHHFPNNRFYVPSKSSQLWVRILQFCHWNLLNKSNCTIDNTWHEKLMS